MAFAMTPAGLRIGGQVELAGIDAAPNWKRAEVLLAFARNIYPGLPVDLPPERVKMWMGHRPSMPDGLPCLGPASGSGDIVYAFGHGHVGLTAGATTGKIVAEIIAGGPVSVDLKPYAATRFA
jgi:D-amino-acid dehydrogenase